MKVVDLADEFGLTTTEAVDACLWAGVPAENSATELTSEDAARVRTLIAGWIDEGFVPWRAAEEASRGNGHGGPAPTTGGRRGDLAEDGGDPALLAGGPPATSGTVLSSRPSSARAAFGTEIVEDRPAPRRDVDHAPSATQPFAGVPMTPRATPVIPPGTEVDLDPSAEVARRAGWLPAGPDAHPRVSPLALVALALGVISLVVPFLPAIAALFVAALAHDRISRSRGWQTGDKLVRGARILAGVGIALWIVLIVGSIAKQTYDKRATVPADVQVSKGTAAYDAVKPGDCVRFPVRNQVDRWELVECGDQHDAEIVGTVTAGNPEKSRYPGEGPIKTIAAKECTRVLDGYLEGSTRDPDLEAGFGYPSAGSWDVLKDRAITCLAFRHDGTYLIGGLKTNPQ